MCLSMFENKKIESWQTWKGDDYKFAPDASPAAWEHYKQYYSEIFEEYDICSPCFFSYIKGNGYISEPVNNFEGKQRLYALPKGTMTKNGYYKTVERLSGETDFNFQKKFYEDYLKDEPEYLKKLKRCRDQHNCLLNFSLMQSMGGMQQFKGRCNDRLDRFIYYLGEFFENVTNNKLENYLQDKNIKRPAIDNRKQLRNFLNHQFDGLQDYCKKVYFISDTKLIEKLRTHGQVELNTPENVKTYIDLAYCFWEEKYSYFSRINRNRKGYLTIGSPPSIF